MSELSQPEYVHTLLNPIPVYGLGIATLALLLGLLYRSTSASRVGLVLIFVTALSAWPVVRYGSAAYDRVLSMSDEAGSAWLAAHAHRANYVFIYYLTALLAAGAIFLPFKWPRSRNSLTYLTLLLAILSLATGSYVAHAGGKIRHREFRDSPPPPTPREG
jgi:hypothetical protein